MKVMRKAQSSVGLANEYAAILFIFQYQNYSTKTGISSLFITTTPFG